MITLFADCGRPLHGLPILVKGNIGTEDKMETAGKLVRGDIPTQQLTMTTSRLLCARWRQGGCGFNCCKEAQTSRPHHPRQDQHVRVGEFQVTEWIIRLERPGRPDICSLLPKAGSQR
jgi:hypothetical protein